MLAMIKNISRFFLMVKKRIKKLKVSYSPCEDDVEIYTLREGVCILCQDKGFTYDHDIESGLTIPCELCGAEDSDYNNENMNGDNYE